MITVFTANHIINSNKTVVTNFGGDKRVVHTNNIIISPIVNRFLDRIKVVNETEDSIVIDFDNLSDIAYAIRELQDRANYWKIERELKEKQGDGFCEEMYKIQCNLERSCNFLKSHWA